MLTKKNKDLNHLGIEKGRWDIYEQGLGIKGAYCDIQTVCGRYCEGYMKEKGFFVKKEKVNKYNKVVDYIFESDVMYIRYWKEMPGLKSKEFKPKGLKK